MQRGALKSSWHTSSDALFWAPLLPRGLAARQQVIGFGALRLEVQPQDRREGDLFLSAFVFGGKEPPEVVCERDGMLVKVALTGPREHRVRFAADDPGKGAVAIKEGQKVLFEGPLLDAGGRGAAADRPRGAPRQAYSALQ